MDLLLAQSFFLKGRLSVTGLSGNLKFIKKIANGDIESLCGRSYISIIGWPDSSLVRITSLHSGSTSVSPRGAKALYRLPPKRPSRREGRPPGRARGADIRVKENLPFLFLEARPSAIPLKGPREED